MTTRTVQLRLQLTGQQAAQQIQRMNLDLSQAQQQQRQNLNQILQTQNRINSSTQQGSKYGQQQLRTGQSMLQTNRLLAQILQQQQRSSSTLNQQLMQQQRSYQLQLNSLRQQVAAAERLRQQLQQAGNAQRDLNRSSPGSNRNLIGGAAGLAGGGYAAGMIGANYLKEPREYMKQISLATDTALAGQKLSLSEFNKKVYEMEGFVRNSSIKGGSSPQQMVQALNTLTASNVYDFNQLKDVMLQVSRTAFGSGADANDVALMTIAQKNFGLNDTVRANDQAMKAGQLGSFELRDMARYMPDLLTQGKGAGYIGDKGYRDLLTMMQLSKKTAGTAEGAAVNLSDLLGSFSQYHLGLSFAKHVKVEKGDPIAAYGVSKKRSGFDWTTYAANMREKGIGEVEAAALIMNRQMEKSPLYQKYRGKAQEALKSGNNSEYLENVQAATQIAAQSEIGKIFHNKQALMAFMGITMNMEKGGFKEELDKGISDSQGTIQISHERQAAQEYGKNSSLETAQFNAKVDNYNGVSGWWGDFKQELADFAASNSSVAAAASAAVVGLTAVAAAGGVAAVAMRGGTLGGIAGAGGLLAGGAGTALKVGGQVAVAGIAGYGVGTGIRNMYMQTETGKNFDDWAGEKIAQILAAFGNDEARAAVEAQNKYDQMIAQQEQQSKEAASQSQLLMSINQNLQNLANKPQPPLIINGSSLLDSVSGSTQKESNRHGSVPSKPLPGLGG